MVLRHSIGASGVVLAAGVFCAVPPVGAQCLDERLSEPQGMEIDRFGYSVASDGDFVLVGVRPDSATQGGARVFRREAGEWIAEPVLATEPRALAGFSVALEGNWAVVGAPGDDSVAIFERRMPGGEPAWVEVDVLSSNESFSTFGDSVAIDGNFIAIGDTGRLGELSRLTGVVEIYKWDGFDWLHEKTIEPTGLPDSAGFGAAVALEGGRLVVGAPHAALFTDAGLVRVYQRRVDIFGNVNWFERAEIQPPDAEVSDLFGWDVAYDGSFLAIGAPLQHSPLADAGAVYAYRRDGSSWLLEKKVVPDDLSGNDWFGLSLAIQGEASPFLTVKLLAGAPGQGGDQGAAYLLNRVELIGQEPDYVAQPTIQNPDAQAGRFGSAVALDRMQQRFVVGAPDALNESGVRAGAAHVYSTSNTDTDGDGVPDPCDLCPGEDDTIDTNANGVPDGCECIGDANGDAEVNFSDITSVLDHWLADYTPGTGPGDADGDGVVNFGDITAVLMYWLTLCG